MYFNTLNYRPTNTLPARDSKILASIIAEADTSSFGYHKHGACLKEKKHMFYGHNTARTKVATMQHTSLHAEIDVLVKASKVYYKKSHDLPSSTIYVTRIKRGCSGIKVVLSKPCEDCQKKLYKYNVTRIFYTDTIDGEEVLWEMRRV